MNKFNRTFIALIIAIGAIAPSPLEAATKVGGLLKKVTGRKSTTDYLLELQALAKVKESLVKIEATRKAVAKKEKEVVSFARKQEIALNTAIQDSEKKLRTLRQKTDQKVKRQ